MTKGISDFKALQSLRNNKQQSNPSSEDIKLSEELGEQIRKLSDIGRALSGVHDLNILLEMIVDQARSFTNAEQIDAERIQRFMMKTPRQTQRNRNRAIRFHQRHSP